jgi:hypothetical protein
VLGVLAVAAAASGIAVATIPDSKGGIHACYNANGTGAVNVYDPDATDGSVPTSCIKGQASFDFNQTGPVGPQGPQGSAGPPGPAGPQGLVGHLDPTVVAAIEQNLAQIQSGLKGLQGAIASANSQQSQQRTAFLRLRRQFVSAKTVAAQLAALSEMSNQTSLALQMAMDRQSRLLTTLSNLEKKLSDTDSTIVQNLK